VFSKRGPLKAVLFSIWFSLQVASLLVDCFNPARALATTAEEEMARVAMMREEEEMRVATGALKLLRAFIMMYKSIKSGE